MALGRAYHARRRALFHDRIARDERRPDVQGPQSELLRDGRERRGAANGVGAVAVELVDPARTDGRPADRDAAVTLHDDVEDDGALFELEEGALGKGVAPEGVDLRVDAAEVSDET